MFDVYKFLMGLPETKRYFSMPKESDAGHSATIVTMIYFKEELVGL